MSRVERSRDAGGWAVLAFTGELDLAMVPAVREAADELVAAGRVHLVWDLSGVTFMDSAGLGVLVHTVRAAEARQGAVRLAAASAQVHRLLELTGVHAVVDTYADVSAATEKDRG
ncbi:STAS domain-containing protein [Streptomyces sp. NPDC088785]|uniref:STAS domain-containing protein n=1 Tax=Streptomyces sp. NPDC088785 TaxID=3365897 RepID=UPI0037FA455D